jgi:hypothetical protein
MYEKCDDCIKPSDKLINAADNYPNFLRKIITGEEN